VGGELLRRDEVEIRERPPALVEAQPVAGEELVRDGEADVVEWDVVDQTPVGAVEERDGGQAGRLAEREGPGEEVQGQPGVDDVFDDEHMAPDDRGVEILQEPHAAAPVAAGVGRELEEVEGVGDRERPRQVGEEDDARLQRRHQQRVFPGVGGRELGPELPDATLDLLAGEVDLPDRVSVRRELAG
jgi:hypothetical protein